MKTKLVLIYVVICSVLLLSVTGNSTQKENFIDYTKIEKITNITPIYAIIIRSPKGKQSKIDFSGDKVTYSGDLPVDEAARLFFDSVNNLCNCKSKQ